MDHHPTSPVIQIQISHRSIRRYTGEPIPGELLAALIRAGQGAASSSFIQAYSIIRVTRPVARAAIARAAGNQPWIEQAAEFLMFCADLRRVDAACRHAGAGPLEGWTEHGLAAVVDVALVAQNVLLQAVVEKLRLFPDFDTPMQPGRRVDHKFAKLDESATQWSRTPLDFSRRVYDRLFRRETGKQEQPGLCQYGGRVDPPLSSARGCVG